MKENTKTKAWELYELGRNYNESLTPNQYNLVETNTEFFTGNQWLRLPNTPAMLGLPKPTFNILKRVASLFIASLTSSGTALRFDPLAYYDGSNMSDPDHDAAAVANAEVETLLDGINVMFGNPNDRRVQEQPYVLIVGRDTVEHLRWEAERFQKNRKNFYKSGTPNGVSGELLEVQFQPDSDYDKMPGVGGKTEIIESEQGTGKALYVYLYTKVTEEQELRDANGEVVFEDVLDANGDVVYETDVQGDTVLDAEGNPVPKRKATTALVTTVHVTKATKTAVIYEDVDTGLSLYPIAWGNWEKQKNQYHGRALVTGLIPNQIFINSMFATAMRHLQLMAFPKTVYNADLISKWDNEIGQAVGVHGLQPGNGISQVADNLQPAEMSNQIFALIDKVMAYTKECLGATDVQMGNVKPDNTSAIMVMQTQSEVPLENIRAGLYEWVEDIGQILLDMIGTYYGKRPVVVDREFEEPVTDATGAPMIDPMTGMMRTQKFTRRVVEEFDFSQFKHLWLNLRVDVGATTYFSEIAMTQTLDNLRRDGTLDVLQYLERIPDKLIPKKQALIDELRGRIAEGTQANAAAGAAIPEPGSPVSGGFAQAGELDAAKKVQGLPTQMATQFAELPNIAKKTALAQGEMRAD